MIICRFFAFFLFLLIVGCGHDVAQLDEREEGNRLLESAREHASGTNYVSAIILLKKALEVYPNMARTHLDMALLLHDRPDIENKERDYIGAIYHYQHYLKKRPATEKREMIQTRTRQAARAFAIVCGETIGNKAASRIAGLENTNALLTEEADKLKKANGLLAEENDKFRVLLKKLIAKKEDLEKQLEISETNVRSKKRNTSVRVQKQVVNVSPRTYTVKPNDSLSLIAKKVYGDGGEWEKIRAANKEMLGNSISLQVGQVLVIP